MKKLSLLLLLFLYLNLDISICHAKTYETPYLLVEKVDQDYKVGQNEKIKTVTYYVQEKINKDYKYLEEPTSEYPLITKEKKYSNYLYSLTKPTLNNIELEEEYLYSYQEIKKINKLNLTICNNLLITSIKIYYKDKLIYESNKNKDTIKLDDYYSPEYLVIDLTFFLNQGDSKGTFTLSNSDYIKIKDTIKDKGFSTKKFKVINYIANYKYDNFVKFTTDIRDKFYLKILTKTKIYKYRKVYYKCNEDTRITSQELLDSYKVIDTYHEYYLYRKEKIETFDHITVIDYLDLSKVIKTSTIPLSKLKFNYEPNGTTLVIAYQDYKINLPLTFKYTNKKSTITKGKVKNLSKGFIAFIIKTIFLRNL
ncbi:MAG TPA: hypothetical protein IAB45_02415 [Candidatus Onthousia faecavium]|nr:hypothetical protein [Candidatus Onthousia faecavium]